MNTSKLLSTLGLCRKAGKLVMGFDAVGAAASAGELSLALLAEDLSDKSAGNIEYTLKKHKIPVCAAPVTMDEIAALTGRRSGILGIADKNLAKAVQNALHSLT